MNKRFAVALSGCTSSPPPPFVRDRMQLTPDLYWDGGGNNAVPASAAGTGPLPHSRMIGASPMAIDVGTFDVWYWSDTVNTSSAAAGTGPKALLAPSGGRHLHPSSRLWATKDSGSILDDDNVGNSTPSPSGEWCAEAVQPGNLEVWAAELSGHRLAVSLLNRSPTAQNITADWSTLGLPSGDKWKVRDVWRREDVGVAVMGSYTAEVEALGVALLVLSKEAAAEVAEVVEAEEVVEKAASRTAATPSSSSSSPSSLAASPASLAAAMVPPPPPAPGFNRTLVFENLCAACGDSHKCGPGAFLLLEQQSNPGNCHAFKLATKQVRERENGLPLFR
eukprot:COSAG06_NODE_5025_length_3782_cov_10.424654_5_plen_335_part_00